MTAHDFLPWIGPFVTAMGVVWFVAKKYTEEDFLKKGFEELKCDVKELKHEFKSFQDRCWTCRNPGAAE